MDSQCSAELSVVILTLNEAAHLPTCLHSAAWAHEVIVLDSGSTDDTRTIAAEAGARVHIHPLRNFAEQRNLGLALARGDWVLMLDADEQIPPALREEIEAAIAAPGDAVIFAIPRRNRMFGQWVRHTGWYPDYQSRLLRRGYVRYEGTVHELPVARGPTRRLTSPLVHENYATVGEFVRKLDEWSTLEVQQPPALPERTSDASLLTPDDVRMLQQPVVEFVRRFVMGEGYRDHLLGLALSLLQAMYPMVLGAKRWEQRTAAEHGDGGQEEHEWAAVDSAEFLAEVSLVLAHSGAFLAEHLMTAILVHHRELSWPVRLALRVLLRAARLGRRQLPGQRYALRWPP